MQRDGRVVAREEALDLVWGARASGDATTIDVHVKRLRAKLEADPARPRHLLTVRGSATASRATRPSRPRRRRRTTLRPPSPHRRCEADQVALTAAGTGAQMVTSDSSTAAAGGL